MIARRRLMFQEGFRFVCIVQAVQHMCCCCRISDFVCWLLLKRFVSDVLRHEFHVLLSKLSKTIVQICHDPPIFLFELLSSLVDSSFISKARFKLPAKANAKWILVMQQSVRTPFETQSNLLRSKHSQKVWTGLNSLPTRYITTSFARPQSLQV